MEGVVKLSGQWGEDEVMFGTGKVFFVFNFLTTGQGLVKKLYLKFNLNIKFYF